MSKVEKGQIWVPKDPDRKASRFEVNSVEDDYVRGQLWFRRGPRRVRFATVKLETFLHNYVNSTHEVRHWREYATIQEKQTCPSCGIAWYWLKRATPENRRHIDSNCKDPFHTEVPK